MVDKITNPPSQKDLIDKVNELVDDKQDTLVSGTTIKTINNTSILGSGNIDIQGGSSYTAGTGIDITNDVISVTSPTLINKQHSSNNSIVIGGTGSFLKDDNQAIGIAPLNYRGWYGLGFKAIAIGTLNSGGDYSVCIGGNQCSGQFSIQLGYGVNTEANSFYVGTSLRNNWKMLGSDGTIPDARISSNIARSTDIPTVNNATLTITQGGVSKGTFTANASSDVTIALDSGVSVIETYSNGTNWYRIYSDGWCEQGGQTSQYYETVTLLKEMADTNDSVSVTCKRGTAPTVQEGNTCGYASSTTQAFICSGAIGVGSFWEVRGYISQGV